MQFREHGRNEICLSSSSSWVEVPSDGKIATYYWNFETQETSWRKPEFVDWVAMRHCGMWYYYRWKTYDTTWDLPVLSSKSMARPTTSCIRNVNAQVDGRRASWVRQGSDAVSNMWSTAILHLRVDDGPLAVTACCRYLLTTARAQHIQRHLWKHEGVLWPSHIEVPVLQSQRLSVIPKWRRLSLFTNQMDVEMLRQDQSEEYYRHGEMQTSVLNFSTVEEWDLAAHALQQCLRYRSGAGDFQAALVDWQFPITFFRRMLVAAHSQEEIQLNFVDGHDRGAMFDIRCNTFCYDEKGLFITSVWRCDNNVEYIRGSFLVDEHHCSLASSIDHSYDQHLDALEFHLDLEGDSCGPDSSLDSYGSGSRLVLEWLDHMFRNSDGPRVSVKMLYFVEFRSAPDE
eukprot:gnl/TRDRNA2_/TRDRNA2_72936_c0_seq1.p1 gnl/TRDRNA2_/TRDRNA2_72936_c0~~gnl/TRDRNA2_/TRDRNA2_72936_c0_seq1.p1  ORF type:complete len:399 (+),score=27.52 gnl/TRDRNA2_/TRDRNA2_72936_c0_seq1:18-1214(+)